MSQSADTIEGIAVAIQATLADQGRPPDLTEAEAADHQAKLTGFRAARQGAADAKSASDGQSVPTLEKWEELWWFCDEVEDLARKKAPTPEAAAAILKVDTSGGFTVKRAYKRCRSMIAALTQFPDDTVIKEHTKAELIAILGEGLDAEDAKAAKKAAQKGAEKVLRDKSAEMVKSNDDTVTIARASWGHGAPQVDVLDRMIKEAQGRTKRKKEHEQPEEKPA